MRGCPYYSPPPVRGRDGAGDENTRGARPPISPRGFTLIELCVVLVLVALVLSITLPRYGGILTRGTLRSEARRLSAAARYLSSEAARTGRTHYLNFDVGKDTYWVTADEGGGKPVEQTGPLAESYVLTDGFLFKDVTMPGKGQKSRGMQRIGFYAHGENDEAVVHLADFAKKRNYSLHLKPYGGRTEIFDYYYK